MKIKIENKKYLYITDNSAETDIQTAFLLTHHNQKYRADAEKNGCIYFVEIAELFDHWNLSDMKIIGITGTNGKTTVTNIIAHVIKRAGEKVAVSGTEGIFLHSEDGVEKIESRTHTTPEIFTTLYNLKTAKDMGVNFFVMEVSSHGIAQKRTEGLTFDVKVFTNLTQDHLDFHETMEEYAAVKSSFFSDSESVKIINADDELIRYNPSNAKTYSLVDSSADLHANDADFNNGISANVHVDDASYTLLSKMIGKFNLYNLLAAIGAVAAVTEMKIGDIVEKIADFSGVAGRMELLHEFSVNDAKMEVFSDYAHTPDAIENVLQSIPTDKRVITVIGAGGDRDRSKRPIMAQIATQYSDMVYLTSDNPRSEKPADILSDMEEGVRGSAVKYKIVEGRKEAIQMALDDASGSVEEGVSAAVAILGKGDEGYIEVMGEKLPYSDKEEVENYFNS